MPERHMGRLFRRLTGKSFRRYLSELRVEKAMELLAESTHDVKAVAAMVGYSDPNYFSRDFRARAGCTPIEFRCRRGNLISGLSDLC